MDQLAQDFRFALKTLGRDLGFTAPIVLILALGIGLNTAVFSVVRAVLLAPLPYEDPARLAMVWTDVPTEDVHRAPSAYANVQDWKARGPFADLATFDPTTLTLTGGAWPEQIAAARTSANLFALLGAAPEQGRALSAEDERTRAAVVVVSRALADRRFGGVAALGRTLELGGVSFEVVGVMPEGFAFPQRETQLWLPQTIAPDWDASAAERGTGAWRVLGRLRPGTSMEQARAEMDRVATDLERAYPSANRGLRVSVVPLQQDLIGASVPLVLWTLFGAVGLVLLIACANGAHMILVRGMNRAQELALRVSLGADSGRLLRLLLTESLVLSAAAALGGVLLAVLGVHVLTGFVPPSVPRLEEVGIDGAVLGYATLIAAVVGVVFGVAPARGLLRGPVAATLREGRSPSPGRAGGGMRRVLIVGQFALAIVLVFGASSLVRSLAQVRRVDPGFQADDVVMANLSVASADRRVAFYEQVVRDAGDLPGVAAAGIVEDVFISGAPNAAITVEGSVARASSVVPARFDAVAGDFFGALGVALREGRGFAAGDGPESARVAIVNETMARRFWPRQSPVGKRFRVGSDAEASWLEVVGVVGDMHRQGLEQPVVAQIFRPYAQEPSRNMVLLVRTDDPGVDVVPALRTRIAEIDPTIPLYQVTTLTQAMDRYLLPRRFQTTLLTLFSAIALVLAAVGVYGLVQYSVAQRTRELGVRVALGGTPRQVLSMILRQGLTLAVQGIAIGTLAALLLAEPLSGLLFGVAPSDPSSVIVAAGLLLVATLAACWVPARRAARIDPMVALRQW